jgi:AcrR family transcriptional regulator
MIMYWISGRVKSTKLRLRKMSTVDPEEKEPGIRASRRYDSSRRRKQARVQRRRVLASASRLFLEQGYAATTLAEVAADADVSVETIYKAFRNKAGLLKEVFDFAVAGDDEPVSMIDRDFAQRIRAEPDPRNKLSMFAEHMAESMPRAAPVYLLGRAAADREPEIKSLYSQWRDDQLRGLGALAAHLVEGGHLRPGLTVDQARDLLWTIHSTEVYELLVLERGWPIADYLDFLTRSTAAALLE